MKKLYFTVIFFLINAFAFCQNEKNFNESEIEVFNNIAKIKLSGTLVLPKSKFNKIVILITGSGNQDRDESLLGHKPFKTLAESLAQNGIASLRMDDRGVGKSEGRKNPFSTSYDFQTDIEAAINWIQNERKLRKKKIGLIGHSEGGMIAQMIAAKPKPGIDFLVSIAGPTCKMRDILEYQSRFAYSALKPKVDSLAIENYTQKFYRPMIDQLIYAKDSIEFTSVIEQNVINFRKDRNNKAVVFIGLSNEKAYADLVTKSFYNPWWKYALAYDPANDLKQIKIPFLTIFGEKDQQVPAESNKICLEMNTKNAKIVILPNMNHLFQTTKTGDPNEYASLKTCFEAPLLNEINHWLNEI